MAKRLAQAPRMMVSFERNEREAGIVCGAPNRVNVSLPEVGPGGSIMAVLSALVRNGLPQHGSWTPGAVQCSYSRH